MLLGAWPLRESSDRALHSDIRWAGSSHPSQFARPSLGANATAPAARCVAQNAQARVRHRLEGGIMAARPRRQRFSVTCEGRNSKRKVLTPIVTTLSFTPMSHSFVASG